MVGLIIFLTLVVITKIGFQIVYRTDKNTKLHNRADLIACVAFLLLFAMFVTMLFYTLFTADNCYWSKDSQSISIGECYSVHFHEDTKEFHRRYVDMDTFLPTIRVRECNAEEMQRVKEALEEQYNGVGEIYEAACETIAQKQ